MLLAVLSDTHDLLPAIDRAVSEILRRNVSIVLHAGDIISPFSLKRFKNLSSKMYIVYGNNDGEKVLLSRLAEELNIILRSSPLVIRKEGYKIVLMHGLEGKEETEEYAFSIAKSGQYDLIVYGHTHEAKFAREGDTLIVNPGEVCGYLTGKKTLAFINLAERTGEIVEL